jgi:hypothetical protein
MEILCKFQRPRGDNYRGSVVVARRLAILQFSSKKKAFQILWRHTNTSKCLSISAFLLKPIHISIFSLRYWNAPLSIVHKIENNIIYLGMYLCKAIEGDSGHISKEISILLSRKGHDLCLFPSLCNVDIMRAMKRRVRLYHSGLNTNLACEACSRYRILNGAAIYGKNLSSIFFYL